MFNPILASQELFRYIDDFLLITTRRSTAARFLQVMCNGEWSRLATGAPNIAKTELPGQPEYGCTVATEKSLVNFGVAIDGDIHLPTIGESRGLRDQFRMSCFHH